MNHHEMAEKNLFFLTVSGSHAYGTNIASSDIDYRGLFYADKTSIITPFFPIEQVEGFQGEKDSVVYEVSKFMRLLVQQNPNILELLWVDDQFVKKFSPQYGLLRRYRHEFLSSEAKFTFCGYAKAQLSRIKGHNKWINNPQPKDRPKETDFVSIVWNFTNNKEYNKALPTTWPGTAFSLGGDLYGMVKTLGLSWYNSSGEICPKPSTQWVRDCFNTGGFDLIIKFNKEAYKQAIENWKNYWTWVENRNETRSELEAKFGFDTKHGMHLIRLLRMGVEILRDGEVHVYRDDRENLKSIRAGFYSYDKLIDMATELEAGIESLFQSTSLRRGVDITLAANILMELYRMSWKDSY